MVSVEIKERYIPMIREVAIDNFKGIKHCEIKDLAKVNLFIGKNGCGKSSIMESIYFTGKEFLGINLPQCLMRRADRGGNWSARELWYGYDTGSVIATDLEFYEGDHTGMRINLSEPAKVVEVTLSSSGSKSERTENLTSRYYLSPFRQYGRGEYYFSTDHNEEVKRYFGRSILIDPAIKIDTRQIETSYLNILKLSEENSSDLAKRTSGIYDTKPSWEFLPHQDFPPDSPSRFAILEGNKRLFFDNFGDGLHYGLAIMAVAKTRTDTALFIEEIESHQHPEAVKNLIPNLLDLARTNNLQLFITTHNDYVRNYLYYHYKTPEARKKEFRCFHVVKDQNSGVVDAKIEEGIVNISEDLFGRPK